MHALVLHRGTPVRRSQRLGYGEHSLRRRWSAAWVAAASAGRQLRLAAPRWPSRCRSTPRASRRAALRPRRETQRQKRHSGRQGTPAQAALGPRLRALRRRAATGGGAGSSPSSLRCSLWEGRVPRWTPVARGRSTPPLGAQSSPRRPPMLRSTATRQTSATTTGRSRAPASRCHQGRRSCRACRGLRTRRRRARRRRSGTSGSTRACAGSSSARRRGRSGARKRCARSGSGACWRTRSSGRRCCSTGRRARRRSAPRS
mmetsp:Transcript_15689/g.61282  ORF Transcript_15689/g.61282 Transcript_15689/m.61282 type:complete len:259 (-) Transcript_15689:871-1647(-)